MSQVLRRKSVARRLGKVGSKVHCGCSKLGKLTVVITFPNLEHVHRSWVAVIYLRPPTADPGESSQAEGAVLYIGPEAAAAMQAIMPEAAAVVDPETPVFGLSASQIGRRVNTAAKAAGLGDGFTGHSGRVGIAQDLAAAGVELPELMTAGWWKSSRMPARGGQVLPEERGLDPR